MNTMAGLFLIPVLLAPQDPSPLPPDPVKGEIIQVLESFDNPEGSIFSADGKYVFISNPAIPHPDKGFGFPIGGGFISKLKVMPDGKLEMVHLSFIGGLTPPLGMAALPVATAKFPAGSIFVCCATGMLQHKDGTAVKDPKRMDPKLVIFDPEGTIHGEIKTGPESAFAQKTGVPALLLNAAAFDAQGNLYLADSGMVGETFDPPVQAKPGVFRVLHDQLDALAGGKGSPETLGFIPVPGMPDGVEAAPDGSIHINTIGAAAGGDDPAKGGLYKLTQDHFAKGELPEPFGRDLGGLDGLTFAGTVRLDTEVMTHNAVVITAPNHPTRRLVLEPERALRGPADIAIRRREDGSWLLIIPELSADDKDKDEKRDAVTVVLLPKHAFERN